MITQGDKDAIVDPAVTARFVEKLCAEHETVEFRLLPGIPHLEGGHVAAPYVAQWIADRFAGKLAPNTCT